MWAHQGQKHQLPIVQFFFGQGAGPYIIVRDYREVQGILLCRNRELHCSDIVVRI